MSDRNQQASELSGISGELDGEQPSCVACGRGQAGDKHTCQQDEQALPKQDASLITPIGEMRAFDNGIKVGLADGERAATKRIVKWLRSDRWVGFRSTCMSLADAIERGEHE